jgi:hypothetical protein
MTITKEARLLKVHQRAMTRFRQIHSSVMMERRQCMQDRRFYCVVGAQWEGPLEDQFENKPKLEINKVAGAVIRLIAEYRNNRFSVTFFPKMGDKGSGDQAADLATGMYRACEVDSSAEEAYDNAFEEAAAGGMGAWRLRPVYENEDDPDDDTQRIAIEPIYDADNRVYFDGQAKEQQKKDADWAFVLTAYERESYDEEWPDQDPATWPMETTYRQFDWTPTNQVIIAEYFEIEKVKVKVQTWETIDGQEEKYDEDDFKEDPGLENRLNAIGSKMVRERTVTQRKVHKYIMNGAKTLSDEGLIPGPRIPIVVTYGKRSIVDGVERCSGVVRLAKDAQRLKNMQVSKLAEISALSSVEKPIFHPEQVAGHTAMWRDDNVVNYPYMLLNKMKDPATGQFLPAMPIAYTKVPNIPPAMGALLQLTEEDMQDILGSRKDADNMVSNISGQAVDLVQQNRDVPTYIYTSNFKKAMHTSGQIWLGMAKEIYVEENRRVKTIDNEGQASITTLKAKKFVQETGVVTMNDLTEADLDLEAAAGPSSASKRIATVRAVTQMLPMIQDPDTIQVLTSVAMINLEGEGLADIRAHFRKNLIRKGVVTPTPEEAQKMAQEAAQQPEDPQATYLKSAAAQADADAVKKRAEALLSVARATESKTNAAKNLHDIGVGEEQHLLTMVEQLDGSQATLPSAQPPASTQP